jgi:Zn-dependent membrane protease YugP
VSLLIWTMCLTLFVSIIFVTDNAWLLFIIGIPLQILNIVWFFLLKR